MRNQYVWKIRANAVLPQATGGDGAMARTVALMEAMRLSCRSLSPDGRGGKTVGSGRPGPVSIGGTPNPERMTPPGGVVRAFMFRGEKTD